MAIDASLSVWCIFGHSCFTQYSFASETLLNFDLTFSDLILPSASQFH